MRRLLLPFTVPSEDQQTALSRKIELATIFCLAEVSRGKGGGLITKKLPEQTLFVTKVCYPFWLVPWRKRTLLFDGLGIMSHKLSFDILPDAGMFLHEIKGSAHRLETYSAFLSHNLNYFGQSSGKGQKNVTNLVMEPSFLKDFISLLPKARSIKDSTSDSVLLSPLVDESAVQASLAGLFDFADALKEDVKNLRNVAKTLARTTRVHIASINKEIQETRRKYDVEIIQFKSESMERIETMKTECDEKILQISEEANRPIQDLNQERVKSEQDKKRLEAYANQCETEMLAARVNNDGVEEERWKQELERSRRELLAANEKLQQLSKSIESAERARDARISGVESEYASQKEMVMAGLRQIEAARDAKIQMCQQSLASLEESTSTAISQLNTLIASRELVLDELSKMGYPIRRRKYALAFVPFFLVCHRQDVNKRYIVFPPSIANSMSGVTRIKGALRSFRVRMLLQEFSASMTGLLNRFVAVVEGTPTLEERIANACAKANILKAKSLCRDIEAGLKELAHEGWLKEEELKILGERLAETTL